LLEQIAAEHPGIHTVQIDTADAASVRSAAGEVLARHPDVNVLIAMAGVMKFEDWHHPDTFLESAESTITTDVLGPTASYNASKAAIHMLTESVRLQLADSAVELEELVPPSVQTDLAAGQRNNDAAMPLDEFLDEDMQLLENEPDAKRFRWSASSSCATRGPRRLRQGDRGAQCQRIRTANSRRD
jgi:uncharacterized oxidoreductase